MSAIDRPFHVAGGSLGRDCHICAFFNGPDEEYRVVRCFIKDGIDGGDESFHIVDPQMRDDHLRRLGDAGIDVEQATATGQLEVRPWEEAHLQGGRFEASNAAMLSIRPPKYLG